MNQSMLILDTPENCECCLCMGGITLACPVSLPQGACGADNLRHLTPAGV
nr:MAG TPA: hypothetical protein [Caudoviricetes sp.]